MNSNIRAISKQETADGVIRKYEDRTSFLGNEKEGVYRWSYYHDEKKLHFTTCKNGKETLRSFVEVPASELDRLLTADSEQARRSLLTNITVRYRLSAF
jgi:hypothetical protein